MYARGCAVDSVAHFVAGIADTRHSKVRYSLRGYLSAVALFFADSSLLQFQRRFQRRYQANNLSSTFGVRKIPVDSQFRCILDRMTLSLMPSPTGGLQRFALPNLRRPLSVTHGSRFQLRWSTASTLHPPPNPASRAIIDILQAAIVHPDKRQVLPLAPGSSATVTAKAASTTSRIAKSTLAVGCWSGSAATIRGWRPVADSLYSKQPFIERLRAARFSFLLVAKPGDHKYLYEDVEGLRLGNRAGPPPYRPSRQTLRVRVGHRCAARQASTAPLINFIQVRIIKAGENPISMLLGAHRRQHRAGARRAGTLEDRERRLQYAQEPGLPPGAQFRPRRPAPVDILTLNLLAFSCTRSSNWWTACISASAPSSVPAVVLGRGALRLPAVSVYLVGPGVGAHELAAAAAAPVSGALGLTLRFVPRRQTSRVDNRPLVCRAGGGFNRSLPGIRSLCRLDTVWRTTWRCRRCQTSSAGRQPPPEKPRAILCAACSSLGCAQLQRDRICPAASLWRNARLHGGLIRSVPRFPAARMLRAIGGNQLPPVEHARSPRAQRITLSVAR